MFGTVPHNAHTVFVYSLDKVLIKEFPSKVAAAEWLKVSNFTVNYYIKKNKVFQAQGRRSLAVSLLIKAQFFCILLPFLLF
jgi:putative flippase GtrA